MQPILSILIADPAVSRFRRPNFTSEPDRPYVHRHLGHRRRECGRHGHRPRRHLSGGKPARGQVDHARRRRPPGARRRREVRGRHHRRARRHACAASKCATAASSNLEDLAGIRISGVKDVTVEENTRPRLQLWHLSRERPRLPRSSATNCAASRAANRIPATASISGIADNILVTGNSVHDHRDGIYLEFATRLRHRAQQGGGQPPLRPALHVFPWQRLPRKLVHAQWRRRGRHVFAQCRDDRQPLRLQLGRRGLRAPAQGHDRRPHRRQHLRTQHRRHQHARIRPHDHRAATASRATAGRSRSSRTAPTTPSATTTSPETPSTSPPTANSTTTASKTTTGTNTKATT